MRADESAAAGFVTVTCGFYKAAPLYTFSAKLKHRCALCSGQAQDLQKQDRDEAL